MPSAARISDAWQAAANYASRAQEALNDPVRAGGPHSFQAGVQREWRAEAQRCREQSNLTAAIALEAMVQPEASA